MKFYIAGSLKDREKIKQLASRLPGEWTHNWPEVEGSAHDCLQGGIDADVFVFIRRTDVSMRTAHRELGARLGSGGSVYLIADDDCLLYMHKNVTRFSNFDRLLERLNA